MFAWTCASGRFSANHGFLNSSLIFPPSRILSPALPSTRHDWIPASSRHRFQYIRHRWQDVLSLSWPMAAGSGFVELCRR
jgi:hypothetical protein